MWGWSEICNKPCLPSLQKPPPGPAEFGRKKERGTRNESHEKKWEYVDWGWGGNEVGWLTGNGTGMKACFVLSPGSEQEVTMCVQTEAVLRSPTWHTNTQTTAGLRNIAVLFCSGRTFEVFVDQESESRIQMNLKLVAAKYINSHPVTKLSTNPCWSWKSWITQSSFDSLWKRHTYHLL